MYQCTPSHNAENKLSRQAGFPRHPEAIEPPMVVENALTTTTMLLISLLCSLTALCWLCLASQQAILANSEGGLEFRLREPSDFATAHLSEVHSTDHFVALSHPDFPSHGVRIKKTEFCDSTVKCVILGCEGLVLTIESIPIVFIPDISTSIMEQSIFSSTFSKAEETLMKVGGTSLKQYL